jgi:hypothetical protein
MLVKLGTRVRVSHNNDVTTEGVLLRFQSRGSCGEDRHCLGVGEVDPSAQRPARVGPRFLCAPGSTEEWSGGCRARQREAADRASHV